MTTIIAIENNEGVTMVADSRVTDFKGKCYSHPSMVKINKRGDFLIGGAGEVSPCDIAQHIWIPPQVTAADKKDLYHFMIAKVMPSLRKCLVENGFDFNEIETSSDSERRFQFLIAVGGEVFDVDQDLAVAKSDDGIYGVGSGAHLAMGALYAGATPMEAMTIAAKASAYTAPPFLQYDQPKNRKK